MPFEFSSTRLPGVIEITTRVFPDDRGEFAELFQSSAFRSNGVDISLKQINYSKSKKAVLRGLHYQLSPKSQGKIVHVMSGSGFDVAVDIRKGSPTYGKWVGVTLSAEKKNMLYIPQGFAHGFCSLEDDTVLVYYCTDEYSPDHERGVVWNDPALNITWPLESPILAERDASYPTLEQAENTFVVE